MIFLTRRRLYRALAPPLLTAVSIPDPRTMVKGKRAKSVAAFAEEVHHRVLSGDFDERGRDLALGVLTPIATTPEVLDAVAGDVARWAAIGLCAAVVEKDWGWTRPGMQDEGVFTFLSWMVAETTGHDSNLGVVRQFLAEGGYYVARVGDEALPVLRDILSGARFRFEPNP